MQQLWPLSVVALLACGPVATINSRRKRQPVWFTLITATSCLAIAAQCVLEGELPGLHLMQDLQRWNAGTLTLQLLIWAIEWNILSVHRKQAARLDGPVAFLVVTLGAAVCTWSIRGVDADVVHTALLVALITDLFIRADAARTHQIEDAVWLWAATISTLATPFGMRLFATAMASPLDARLHLYLSRALFAVSAVCASMIPRAGHELEEVAFPALLACRRRTSRDVPPAEETMNARQGKSNLVDATEIQQAWDHGITNGGDAVFPRQSPGPLPFFHRWPLHQIDHMPRPAGLVRCFLQWPNQTAMFRPMAMQRIWHTFLTPVELYLYLWNAAQDVLLLNSLTELGCNEDNAAESVRSHLSSRVTTDSLVQLEALATQHSQACFARCMLADGFSVADFLAVCRLQIEYHAVAVSLSEAGLSPWCMALEAVLKTHRAVIQRARGLAVPLATQWRSVPAVAADLWIQGVPTRRDTARQLIVESKTRSGDGSLKALTALMLRVAESSKPSTPQLRRPGDATRDLDLEQQQLRVILAFMQDRQMYFHMMFRVAYNRYVPLAVFNVWALQPASPLRAIERTKKHTDLVLRAYQAASVLGVHAEEGDVYVLLQRSLTPEILACSRSVLYDEQHELPIRQMYVQTLGAMATLPDGYVMFMTNLWNAHVHGTYQLWDEALKSVDHGKDTSIGRGYLTISQNIASAAFRHLDTEVVWGWPNGSPVPMWIMNMDTGSLTERARVHIVALSFMISLYTGHAVRSLIEMYLGPHQTPSPPDAELQVGQGLPTPLFQNNPWGD